MSSNKNGKDKKAVLSENPLKLFHFDWIFVLK